jgi:hypothetical protein
MWMPKTELHIPIGISVTSSDKKIMVKNGNPKPIIVVLKIILLWFYKTDSEHTRSSSCFNVPHCAHIKRPQGHKCTLQRPNGIESSKYVFLLMLMIRLYWLEPSLMGRWGLWWMSKHFLIGLSLPRPYGMYIVHYLTITCKNLLFTQFYIVGSSMRINWW